MTIKKLSNLAPCCNCGREVEAKDEVLIASWMYCPECWSVIEDQAIKDGIFDDPRVD